MDAGTALGFAIESHWPAATEAASFEPILMKTGPAFLSFVALFTAVLAALGQDQTISNACLQLTLANSGEYTLAILPRFGRGLLFYPPAEQLPWSFREDAGVLYAVSGCNDRMFAAAFMVQLTRKAEIIFISTIALVLPVPLVHMLLSGHKLAGVTGFALWFAALFFTVRFMRRRQYALAWLPMLTILGLFFIIRKLCD